MTIRIPNALNAQLMRTGCIRPFRRDTIGLPKPAIDVDWAQGIPADWAFTRNSPAYYTDATGTLVQAAAGEARTGHHVWDGRAWVPAGILLEPEGVTNELLWSEDFINAVWSPSSVDVIPSAGAAPDGRDTATRLTNTDTINSLSQDITVVAAADYAASIYIKNVDAVRSRFAIFDNIGLGFQGYVEVAWTGDVPAISTISTATDVYLTRAGNGWWRLQFAVITDAASTDHRLIIYPEISGALASMMVWGAQVNTGRMAGSYAYSNAANGAQAADDLRLPAANLSLPGGVMPAELSLATEGAFSYAKIGLADTVRTTFWFYNGAYFLHRLDTLDPKDGEFATVQSVASDPVAVRSRIDVYTPGLDVPYSWASRHGSGFQNGAHEGNVLTEGAPPGMPDLSQVDLRVATSGIQTAKRFRAWWKDIGDDGLLEITVKPLASPVLQGTSGVQGRIDGTVAPAGNNFETAFSLYVPSVFDPLANGVAGLVGRVDDFQSNASQQAWHVRLHNDGRLELRWNIGGSLTAIGSDQFPKDQWFIVTANHDGTTARLFVDGQLVAEGAGVYAPQAIVNYLFLGSPSRSFARDLQIGNVVVTEDGDTTVRFPEMLENGWTTDLPNSGTWPDGVVGANMWREAW